MVEPGRREGLGPADAGAGLTTFLLDSSVVIEHLRGSEPVSATLRSLGAGGHRLAVSSVTVVEVLAGATASERKGTERLLRRLAFLATDLEASVRAGDYRAEFRRKGVTLHSTDALIAGTARAHGAVLLTHNLRDFPMRDIAIEAPPS